MDCGSCTGTVLNGADTTDVVGPTAGVDGIGSGELVKRRWSAVDGPAFAFASRAPCGEVLRRICAEGWEDGGAWTGSGELMNWRRCVVDESTAVLCVFCGGVLGCTFTTGRSTCEEGFEFISWQ